MRHLLRIIVLLCCLTAFQHASAKREWKVLEHENITIYSAVKDKRTLQIFEEIKLFQGGVRMIFNGKIQESKWPLVVIVCDGEKTFSEITRKREKGQRKTRGFYQRGASYDLIVIKGNEKSSTLKGIMYHEMGHRIIEDLGEIPLWLDEGYAQIFERFDVKGEELRFGLANDPASAAIIQYGPMDFERLFLVHHQSDEYRIKQKSRQFYATSWALVHACMYGLNGEYKQSFYNFVNALKQQPPSEALFQSCFGLDYNQMQSKLRKHTNGGKYYYTKININKELQVPTVSIRKATGFESMYYRSCVLLHSKRYQEARNSLVSSELYLEPLQENTETCDQSCWAKLYAAYALAAFYEKNIKIAQEYAEKAVNLGSDDYSMQLLYAEKILGVYNNFSSNSDLSDSELKCLLKIINETMGVRRNDKRSHRIHARIWRKSPKPPGNSHRNALFHACKLYPNDIHLIREVASVFEKHHEFAQSIEILRFLKRNNPTEEVTRQTNEKIDQLSKRLPMPTEAPATKNQMDA